MKCKKCGFEMPEQAKFCMMCGAPMEKAVTSWADDNVEVFFESIRESNDSYFFCFQFKNHSGKNIVPIMYSLSVNGSSLAKDALLVVNVSKNEQGDDCQSLLYNNREIFNGGDAICFFTISKDRCTFDIKNIRSIMAAPAYCLRGDDGYNYGADQYNLPEQACEI